jgi:predicted dehydrogenase
MIKVGIMGAGAIAPRAHIASYHKTNGVKIIGVSDSNEGKAKFVAKKNVLCEKPLSLYVKGVEEIFRETEKSNRICMIAYMRRFMKTSPLLKEFIDTRRVQC